MNDCFFVIPLIIILLIVFKLYFFLISLLHKKFLKSSCCLIVITIFVPSLSIKFSNKPGKSSLNFLISTSLTFILISFFIEFLESILLYFIFAIISIIYKYKTVPVIIKNKDIIFLILNLESDSKNKKIVSKHFIIIITLDESNLVNKSDKILL